MRDLDERLTELRETLLRGPRPDLRDVVERAHRRRTRRRTQLATVVVVALIAVAIPFLRGGAVPSGPAAPTTPPAEQTHVPSADFFDSTHGFVLWNVCGTPSNCGATLQYTADGHTWQRRNGPPDTLTGPLQIHALGPRAAVIFGRFSDTWWFTPDAGQTWRVTDNGWDLPSVDQIPLGAMLMNKCDVPWRRCPSYGIEVVLPTTGDGPVSAQWTDFPTGWVQSVPDSNGTWWVFGFTEAGDWSMASSRDNGRSWQAATLPTIHVGTAMVYQEPVVVSVGRVLYTYVSGERGTLLAVLHSADAGRTWQTTWQANTPGAIRLTSASPYVTATGELVFVGAGRLYIAGDEGRSWREQPGEPPFHEPSSMTRAGYLTMTFNGRPRGWSYRLATGDKVIEGDIPPL